MLRRSRFLQKVMTIVAPGAFSRSASETLQSFVNPMNGRIVAEVRVKNRVSGHENKTGQAGRVVPRASGASIKQVDETAIKLRDVEDIY